MNPALIFDLDGTLVDSLRDIADAANHVLRARDLPAHPVEAYRRFVGGGITVLMERALPPERQELVPVVVEEVRAYYREHLVVATTLYPGVAEMLDALVERGLPLAILSNKPHALTEQVAARLLRRWPFAPLWGQRAEVPRKPDPAGALAAATALGRAPSACLFVGDTKTDMQTASSAGMVPVGVLWGFRERAELEAHGARHVLAHPDELLGLPELG